MQREKSARFPSGRIEHDIVHLVESPSLMNGKYKKYHHWRLGIKVIEKSKIPHHLPTR